jgi:hypothetical protein
MRYIPRILQICQILSKPEWVIFMISLLIVMRLFVLPNLLFSPIRQPDFQIFIEDTRESGSVVNKQNIEDLLEPDQSLQIIDSEGREIPLTQQIHDIMIATSTITGQFNQVEGDTIAILNKDFIEPNAKDQALGGGSIDLYTKNGDSWTFQERITSKDIRQVDPAQNFCLLEFPYQFSLHEKSLIISCESAVHVFSHESGKWVHKQRISPQDLPTTKDSTISKNFASQVIHDAKSLVIRPHRVYRFSDMRIFERNSTNGRWEFKQDLADTIIPLWNPSEQRIALDKDTIFIGYSNIGSNGSVNIYRQNAYGLWKISEKVSPGNIDRLGSFFRGEPFILFDYGFGGSVSVDNNYMLVACEVPYGAFKRFNGEIVLFRHESKSDPWQPIARLGIGRSPVGETSKAQQLWGAARVSLAHGYAAVATGDGRFDGKKMRYFRIVNFYKLK